MILDLFSELQYPGAKTPDDFRNAYTEALAQAELADELGFGCWWAVEHHGTPAFSLSSTPEMMLLAIAQKTRRIRLGHAAVLAPFHINHPLRVAERAAFLDLMSGGRLQRGLARAGGAEWET
ncbi:MAG: LLM class flavin-dependent oxidoreductase, partial [Proteobacteria bacterium]|nr:LLM class flavin-dependent oxidoreductase [Pseudomonadota bacterium]